MSVVSPQLSVRRGREAVEFYKESFWVSDESPEHGHFSPESLGGTTTRILLVVDDPQAVVERAVSLGATEYIAVQEGHGWLLGRIEDPYGHHWEIGKPLGDWPPR
jgi:PhnB protein